MKSPLSMADAKKLLKKIMAHGEVTYSVPHALQRLEERSIAIIDCKNVLRAGEIEPDGVNRFRVNTNKMALIIEFLSDAEVLVVTAWKVKL